MQARWNIKWDVDLTKLRTQAAVLVNNCLRQKAFRLWKLGCWQETNAVHKKFSQLRITRTVYLKAVLIAHFSAEPKTVAEAPCVICNAGFKE